jgi:hypothetical protein
VSYTPEFGFTGSASFAYEASDGRNQSERDGVCRIEIRRELVPWLEVNTLEEDLLESAARSLRHWQRVTDTAIISTEVRKASVYYELGERVPGMIFIPGMKTSPVFGLHGFDDAALWAELATEVEAVCHATGQSRVVIENESALKAYYQGEEELDFDQVRQGLAQLPAGIQYLWYPSVAGSGEVLARYVQLCAVVDEVVNARFIDHASLNMPDAVGGPMTAEAVAELEAVVTRSTIPLIYCTEGKWPFERIPEALGHVSPKWGEDAWGIIYPGLGRWETAAEVIATVMSEAP